MKALNLERVRKGDELLATAKIIRPSVVDTPVPVAEILDEIESIDEHTNTQPTNQAPNMEPLKIYTPVEAAALLSIHPETLMRYVREGRLRAMGGGVKGRPVRISLAELEKFWKAQGGGEMIRPKDETVHA